MSTFRTVPLALLLCTALAPAQEKHQLRFKFKAGAETHLHMVQEMDMQMSMGAQPMGTKMSTEMFMTCKILTVKDDTAEIEQTLTRVKAKMKNPMMGNIDYDSDDEDSDPGPMEMIADMVGEKFKSTITSQGVVKNVDVPAGVADAMPNLQQMFGQSFQVLPDTAVAIGDTWQSEINMPMDQMGESKMTVINKLLAVTGDHATIEQTMKLDADGAGMAQGMKIQLVSGKGTNKVDMRTGMSIDMVTEMELKISGGEMPMAMTMKSKQTMKQVPTAGGHAPKPPETPK